MLSTVEIWSEIVVVLPGNLYWAVSFETLIPPYAGSLNQWAPHDSSINTLTPPYAGSLNQWAPHDSSIDTHTLPYAGSLHQWAPHNSSIDAGMRKSFRHFDLMALMNDKK